MTVRTALVVVPTYNELANLPLLVAGLMEHPNLHLLLVDDQSPDGTGDLADRLASEHAGRIRVLHRTGHRGLGRSYVDGLKAALREPVDVVCQMDADLSHDPVQLPALIAAVDEHDVVIGSRYVPGGRIVNWPLRRRVLSRFANLYVRTVTRLAVHDCTSGFRCWRREALASLPFDRLTSDGYAFLVELLYAAARRGCRITEVPITFVERRRGQSKLSHDVLIESAIAPWRIIADGL